MRKNVIAVFSALILSLACIVFVNAQADNNQTTKQQTTDKKLKILKKPIPTARGCTQSSGFARVRVTFDKSGKVTEAEITNPSGCAEFDNNALKAARRIKFEPQIKDGEPVTVAKPVEYKYYRY